MSDAWPAEDFDDALARAGRVVVLFEASWCPHSRVFAPAFEEADAESELRFARADLSDLRDPRWTTHRIRATPTVAYFEHGEELERLEAAPHTGIDKDRFHDFLDTVHGLQDAEGQPRKPPRKVSRLRRSARAAERGRF